MLGPDSNFYHAFSLAADIVVVNVLMVLCSLPLVTAGAAMRAGNVVISQLIDERGSRPAATFFAEFRRHARLPMAWGTLVIGLLALSRWEMAIIDRAELGSIAIVMKAGLISGLAIVLGISLWLYVSEATRPRGGWAAVEKAAVAAIAYLPRTLIGLAMLALPLGILMLSPGSWPVVIAFYLIIGVALTFYLFQLLVRSRLPLR